MQVGIYFLHKYLLKLVAEEDPRNGGANGIGLHNVPTKYLGYKCTPELPSSTVKYVEKSEEENHFQQLV